MQSVDKLTVGMCAGVAVPSGTRAELGNRTQVAKRAIRHEQR